LIASKIILSPIVALISIPASAIGGLLYDSSIVIIISSVDFAPLLSVMVNTIV